MKINSFKQRRGLFSEICVNLKVEKEEALNREALFSQNISKFRTDCNLGVDLLVTVAPSEPQEYLVTKAKWFSAVLLQKGGGQSKGLCKKLKYHAVFWGSVN